MLDIYEMQIFLAAAETGSFSEAGRRLQMSQPAVSMQIRSLEKRLDVQLFHRSGRHIRLTESGQALIPMARDLVNRSIHIQETLASMQGEVIGELKLGCSTTAGKYTLPRIIASFLEDYPEVQVSCMVVSRGSAIKLLLENEAHVAITSCREQSKELEYRQFMLDPVVLIVPPTHRWAQRDNIHFDELPEARYIKRELRSGTQQTIVEALANHGLTLDDLPTVMTLGSSEAIAIAVAEGIGVAFVSRRAAEDSINLGRVIEVPVIDLEMAQQLYMIRRANNVMTAAASAFWDFVYQPDNRYLLGQLEPEKI